MLGFDIVTCMLTTVTATLDFDNSYSVRLSLHATRVPGHVNNYTHMFIHRQCLCDAHCVPVFGGAVNNRKYFIVRGKWICYYYKLFYAGPSARAV